MEQAYLKRNKGLSGQAIRLIAIGTMLCDHLWITIAQEYTWLTCVGRIAFPLFAFLLVEGFYHTSSRPNYLFRLLAFAVISEIPFNLMRSGRFGDSDYQNVLWTLSLGLISITVIHFIKSKLDNVVITGITTVAIAIFTMYLADSLLTDYYGYGILTILLFYSMRHLRYAKLGQLLGMTLINVVWMNGVVVSLPVLGQTVAFPLQSFALLSLLFIWKYNGTRGTDNWILLYASYAFYPLHMLILGLLALNGITLG